MEATTAGARTLERGLSLIDHVAAGNHRLEDITKAAGLSRSATHRMLTSLVGARYLSQAEDRSYHLGVKLLELGTQAQTSIDLPGAVQQILSDIARITLDATHLGILSGDEVVYLAKARGHRGFEMTSYPGVRRMAQTTALGKVLLAEKDDSEAIKAFNHTITPTPLSIRTAEDFLTALHQAKQNGYAMDDQENELGITCLAIGIPDLSGAMAAAVSVSAPSVHMTPERIQSLVALLQKFQPELTSCLPPGFERAWI